MPIVRLRPCRLALLCSLLFASPLAAQPATLPHARLWTVTPAGGQAGATVRVVLAGVDLEEATALRFSQPGLVATPAPDPAKPGAFLPSQFDVKVAADAPLGSCDVRAVGRYGVSNPRRFCVGDMAELSEKEPNDDQPAAQPLPPETTLSGVIAAPADVDWFKVEGKAGRPLVVACAAESIDSRLDPELRLFDAAGKLLAKDRRHFGREARVAHTPAADGPLFVRLCSYAHQTGDAHHFYRLTATQRPEPMLAARGMLRPALLGLERPTLSAVLAKDSSPTQPQDLVAPCEVAGRFLRPGQMDWFRLTAKKDQVLITEGFADRLGAPLDLYFELRRADTGQLLGEFDDPSEPLLPLRFYARTDDPKARLAFPADGQYLIGVGARDRQSAGPRLAYRLALRPERPDFRLAAMENHPQSPGGVQLARGSGRTIEVHLRRSEGFAGPVRLRAEGLPPGVTAVPQVVPAGVAQTLMVLSAAAEAPPFVGPLKLIGAAEIGGKTVEHEAEAACLVWPNPGEPGGVPAVSRLCAELLASVREAPPFAVHADLESAAVAPGSVAPIQVRLQRLSPDGNGAVSLVPLVMPPGAVWNGNNQPVVVPPGKSEATVTLTLPANLTPGRHTFALAATAAAPFGKDPKGPKAPVAVTEVARPIQLEVFAVPAETKLKAETPPPPPPK